MPPARPLLLALAAVALASSADAQARFSAACAAQRVDVPPGTTLAEACACTVGQAAARGVSGADLDALHDYAATHPDVAAGDFPAPLLATGREVGASLATCLYGERYGQAVREGRGPAAASGAASGLGATQAVPGRTVEVTATLAGDPAVTGSATATVRPASAGLRTGNGTGPVRTVAAGAGTAIRIVN